MYLLDKAAFGPEMTEDDNDARHKIELSTLWA
jgi:hypothetical protein